MGKAPSTKNGDAILRSAVGVRTHRSERANSEVRIVRVSEVTVDVLGLLQEYYEAIGVLVRDTPEAIHRIVEDPDGGVWIASVNGAAVGCAYLHSLHSIPFAAECKRLYVKSSARGHGVGQRLLDALEVYAKARGFKRIYLDSKDDLTAAIDLYARSGYVSCERYNENPQATVFMVKDIEDKTSPPPGPRSALCEPR